MKNVEVTFTLTKEQFEAVNAVCARHGTNPGDVAKSAFFTGIEDRDPEKIGCAAYEAEVERQSGIHPGWESFMGRKAVNRDIPTDAPGDREPAAEIRHRFAMGLTIPPNLAAVLRLRARLRGVSPRFVALEALATDSEGWSDDPGLGKGVEGFRKWLESDFPSDGD